MDFFTYILRQSGNYWVALCLENGLVGQGLTKDDAMVKVKEAVASFHGACAEDAAIETQTISIKELHEFLTIEKLAPAAIEIYELRAVYA